MEVEMLKNHRVRGRWKTPVNGGFTLLELVLVLALSSLLAVLIAQPLAALFDARTALESEVAAKEELNFSLTRMSNEIRGGSVQQCEDGKLQTGDECWQEDDGELTLSLSDCNGAEDETVFAHDDLQVRLDSFICDEHAAPDIYEIGFELDNGEELRTLVAPRN